MDCLNDEDDSIIKYDSHNHTLAAIIKLPYYSNHKQLTIYAHSINNPAWQSNRKHDFPILLSDKGQSLDAFTKQPHFSSQYLTAWQLEIANHFNTALDLQTPHEIECKYNYKNGSIKKNLTSLTHYYNMEQQLCSFAAFLITAHDLYNIYF